MHPATLRAFSDEVLKIKEAGGTLGKVLMADVAPGAGPLKKRLAKGLSNIAQIVRSQHKRHGLRGML